jgi:hypothetical protein
MPQGKLPSYLQSLHHIRPARPSMGSSGLGSDVRPTFRSNKTPGSFQTYLLFTMYAEHASAKANAKLLFLQKTNSVATTHTGQRPSAIVGQPVQSAAPEARQRQDKIWWS